MLQVTATEIDTAELDRLLAGEYDHEESCQSAEWARVVEVLHEHYHDPDIEAARVLYSAVAAHTLKGQPVWVMAVAPPGSMKSELITALDGLPGVLLVDKVTSKTFISGQIKEGRPTERQSSLLLRIGPSGVLLISDFSTVNSLKGDDRDSVYADLRKIYDGKLSKEFGTSDVVPAWTGKITIVAGTTPQGFESGRTAIQALGERFVPVRWDRAGVEAARVAIRQDNERARTELTQALQALLFSAESVNVDVPDEWATRIVDLAEIVARGRTHVDRDPYGKEVRTDPQPESATRLAQQLTQLAKGSARLDRRTSIGQVDFAVALRAGCDCIPPRRLRLLRAAEEGNQIARRTSTTTYDVGDLQLLGLLEEDGRLTPLARGLFRSVRRGADQMRDLTIPPPSANEGNRRSPEVGGRFREDLQEPRQ